MSDLAHSPTSQKLKFWLGPILFFCAFLVYGGTIGHGYVWDDAISITENPRVQAGLSGIPDHFEFRARKEIADFNGYRPVTLSSHSLDIALFGPQPEPAHLMQLFYFGALCWLIFFFLARLFPNAHYAYAFIAALLFLVHPIHVEVVANLKSRDELLALFFGLLSALAFLSFHRDKNWLSGILAVLCFVLAMLSKENAIAFLGLYGLIALLEPRKTNWVSWLWIGGMGITMLLVFWALTGQLPGASPPEATTAFIENIVVSNSHAVDMAPIQRLMNSGYLLLLYLWNFFVPLKQVYFSGANHIPVLEGFSFMGLLGLLIYPALLSVSVWWWTKAKHRPLAFGLLFFLGALLIYLQLFFQVSDTMADRFMFTPSLGLCCLVSYGLFRLDTAILEKNPFSSRHVPQAIVLALLILGLGTKVFMRSEAWEDNLTLFQTDMPQLQESARAHYYLAQELESRFRAGVDQQESRATEIISHYRQSIAIRGEMFYARTDLGNFLTHLQRFPEAIEVLTEANRIFPEHPDPLFYLGQAQFKSGEFSSAQTSFEKTLAMNPGDQQSRELYGRACVETKDFDKGLFAIEEGLRQQPRHIMFRDVQSDLYYESGAVEASFVPLIEITELDPENSFFWKKIIGRFQLLGDQENASRYYQNALDLGILNR